MTHRTKGDSQASPSSSSSAFASAPTIPAQLPQSSWSEMAQTLWSSWYAAFTAPWVKHFVAGGVAGGVSRTVVSPLERMKILFQVQGAGANTAYRGIWGTLVQMWREEGFRGYMRGNGTNVVRIVPYSAVQFASYEHYKKVGRDGPWDQRTWCKNYRKTELTTIRRLTAGALAGITSVAATYPLDIIRTRLSVQSGAMMKQGPGSKLPGIWETGVKMYREEGGVRSLFRGLGPTMTGVAPYVALNFQAYEVLRMYFTPEGETAPSSMGKLVCGALAGTIAQTCTYPLDVLRRRMQVTGMSGVGYKYGNTFEAVRSMVASEGIRGLYRGMIPNYLKVAPAIGVSFMSYEWCKTLLSA
ncbi:MAG: mitochondrial carrier domain-containing protein [Piptocephalis tieghemiana]|nr:MAG: mitochondrial carrier domain-containing protein [Piptocephalis tieghemiana]